MGVGAKIGIAEDTSRGKNLRSLDVSATRTEGSSCPRAERGSDGKGREENGEDASPAQADREKRFHTKRARQIPDHPASWPQRFIFWTLSPEAYTTSESSPKVKKLSYLHFNRHFEHILY